ncbi:MAG TPA: hypothetical protein VL241_12490 [Gemmatimonadales bacterium]|nr:hypothetical protein [Gemmatimonadales bacterium]
MRRYAMLVSLGGLAASAAPLAAQLQRLPRKHPVELTFAGGMFQPTGPGGQAGSVTLSRRPAWAAAVLFGAYAKSGRWGAEVSAGYTPERVSQGGQGSHRTHLTYATLRGLLGKSPRKPGVSVMVGAGLSVIHRQYGVTDFDVATTNYGGSASLLIRIPIDDQVGLRLDAQDLITRADFGTGKKLRNDLALTAGLGISW